MSKADYLKKYLSSSSTSDPTKKKKKKKSTSSSSGLRIIDDDYDWKKDRIEMDEGEDGPVIVRAEELLPASQKKKRGNGDDDVVADEDAPLIYVERNDGSGWNTIEPTKPTATADRDASPPRRRHDSPPPDASPPRRSRTADADSSPPRRRQASPPPSSRSKVDADSSPPRRRQHQSSDSSPPRRRQASTSPDASPPRRRQTDADSSPPRRRQASPDPSPPRRRQASPDPSPPRRRQASPDASPPRRIKQEPSSSSSTTIKHEPSSPSHKRARSPDASPPRRVKRESPSPPRRVKRESSPTRDSSPPRSKRVRLDGLVDGDEFSRQAREKYEARQASLASMDAESSGKYAATVVRDKSGRKMTQKEIEDAQAKARGEKKEEEPALQWGRGLVQDREKEEARAALEAEADTPFARTKDDVSMNARMREESRWGDPMAVLLARQRRMEAAKAEKEKREAEDEDESDGTKKKKKKKDKKKEKKEKKKEKKDKKKEGKDKDDGKKVAAAPAWEPRPMYTKGPAWINRFGILPGYRWDGIDRSNSWERKRAEFEHKKRITAEAAYKWSSEDM